MIGMHIVRYLQTLLTLSIKYVKNSKARKATYNITSYQEETPPIENHSQTHILHSSQKTLLNGPYITVQNIQVSFTRDTPSFTANPINQLKSLTVDNDLQ